MARPKKAVEEDFRSENVEIATEKPLITKLSIDYPNEGLNDIARKINELIDRVHGA
jgi:2-polyprenyl-3-methyl-5-hydroxy-6-metoxy-1,4-benzoquinol methylase